MRLTGSSNQRTEHTTRVVYETIEEARAALIAKRIDPDVLERAMMPPTQERVPLHRPRKQAHDRTLIRVVELRSNR